MKLCQLSFVNSKFEKKTLSKIHVENYEIYKFTGKEVVFETDADDYIEYVRTEAQILVNGVLEECADILAHQQSTDPLSDMYYQNGDNGSIGANMNGDSDSDFAITCEVNGLDVVKSPTIESFSGKSFDDNMSLNNDPNILVECYTSTNISPSSTTTNLPPPPPNLSSSICQSTTESTIYSSPNAIINTQTTTTTTSSLSSSTTPTTIVVTTKQKSNGRTVENRFERLSSQVENLEDVADKFDQDFDNLVGSDEISNLQGDFSKISWDESVSGTTTAADAGLGTPDNDLQDLPTGE